MNYSQLLLEMKTTSKHLLILGRGGSGKTHLIKQFLSSTDLNTLVTAPTGLAAMSIPGASTNHSAFGLLPTVAFSDTKPRLAPQQKKAIEKADVWLVDEISMLRGDLFNQIDATLKHIRNDPSPLGGLRIIAVGDFWQLSPVSTAIDGGCLMKMGITDSKLDHGIYGTSVFDEVLQNCKIVELQGVFRQKACDKAYLPLLDRCRRGNLTTEDLDILEARVMKTQVSNLPVLTTTRAASDLYNNACLSLLAGNDWKAKSSIHWEKCEIEDKTLLEECPGSKTVVLKAKMRVMFTKNDQYGNWVNGSQGTLVGLDLSEQEPNRLAVLLDGRPLPVIVHKLDFSLYRPHYDSTTKRGFAKVVATVRQFPIEPAYASTIHRCQGRTLPGAVVYLGAGAFVAGQTYVALSRVPNLEALHLASPIRQSDVIVSPMATKFYNDYEKSIVPVFPD